MTGPAACPLSGLDALPIDVDPARIEAAMAPFLLSEGDRRTWRKALNRRWRRALLRVAGRLVGRQGRRDRSAIESEYSDAWSAGFERYHPARRDLRGTPWIWRSRRLLLDPAGATRIRSLLFAAVLEELRPRHVLEVGCGNGINLLTLAGAFPEIRFTGLDLTEEGIQQARRAQSDPAILDILQAYSPLPMRDRSAIGRIEFVRGDASAMPFEDGSFDLVMTVLAVEQMERIRSQALGEIARVSGGHVLMLEPFRDVNARGFKRLYIQSRDYFRGSIDELAQFNLAPLWATDDFPQEAFLGAALVLSHKAGPAGP